ncbi:hypothetical protein I6E68_02560 [Salinibacterium sp. NSLL150]|uniref:hypothetical protein n=1 Tax=unclassified Salinibacterium TaxID=2632331 RepID=UPI0018CEEBB7|nr:MULTISPECIES: hypothetical protein [unclassified Salinibacterium]MBH0098019.1 hypothetical protein [Salinibacterium sp. NSLL35]MBH0100774.1 hypothetical protein [Salinibacterium sp. NSLL150]MBH0103533.1 hypothetical protein [Salinibacterium sp. NSLL16]MBH0106294.1 hypothetical protein [Salinibacterium sp. NSLL17]
MNHEESLRLVGHFWVPLATIVPVIALAYILEARSIASTWSYERRWWAFVQGAVILSGGVLLIALEVGAFYYIITPTFSSGDVLAAATVMTIVMAVVVGYPLIHINSIATTPVVGISAWATIRSLFWFKKRTARKVIAAAAALEARSVSLLESVDSMIAEATAQKNECEVQLKAIDETETVRIEAFRRFLLKAEEALEGLGEQRSEAMIMIAEAQLAQTELQVGMENLTASTSRNLANEQTKADIERGLEQLRRMR